MKIRTRVILSFLVVFLLSAGVMGAVLGVWVYNNNFNQMGERVLAISESRAKLVITFFEGQKEMISLTSVASIFRDFLTAKPGSQAYEVARTKAALRLERSLQIDPGIEQILILDNRGVVLLSTNPIDLGKDKSTDEYFVKGKVGTHIKGVYYSDTLGKNAYALSAPIRGDGGILLGVLVARMDVRRVYKMMSDRKGEGKTGEAFLVNRDRYMVTPSYFLGEENVLEKKIVTQNVNDCFTDEEDKLTIEFEGEASTSHHVGHLAVGKYDDYRGARVLATHHYIPDVDWCLVTKMDESELNEPLMRIGAWMLVGGVVASLTFVLVGVIVSGRISGPLDEITRKAVLFSKNDFLTRVKVERSDELGILANTINKMADEVTSSRRDLDRRVGEQTEAIAEKNRMLEEQQLALVNAFEDVEKEKMVSEKRAQDLQKFQLAVENASDHVVITDVEGIVLYANRGMERITGFSQEEVLGKKAGVVELWGGQMPKEFYEKMWKTIKTEKKSFVGELRNKRKDGSGYWAFSTISPIMNEKGEVIFFVGIERDVTREKELDEMKTEFLSVAAHQLRTPLGSMRWNIEMLASGELGDMSQGAKKVIEAIYASNRHLIELVNGLLNVSRIDQGRVSDKPEPTDLVMVIEDCVKEILPLGLEKGVKINLIAEKIQKIILDPGRFREVIMNLLSNSIKYNRVDGKVEVKVRRLGEEVEVRVADTGIGIPEESKFRLFTKFYRAENAVLSHTEGSGLGLFVVKKYVESWGGKVSVESKSGEGTTMIISLPLVPKNHILDAKLGEKK